MEPNSNDEVQPATPIAKQGNEQKKSHKALLTIFGIFIIFLIISGISGGYYMGMQKNSQSKINPTPSQIPTKSTEAISPTNLITPSVQPIINNGWIKFTHPVVGYSFDYPGNWKGGLQKIPKDIKQDYQDFNIESPDHKISDGYPILAQGAEIFVRAEKTTKNSIDDIFNSDPLIQEIAINKTFTAVDGQRAIQFDYSYETNVATMTLFTKNGIYYTAKLRYVDKNGKQIYWNDYVKLLESFKIK